MLEAHRAFVDRLDARAAANARNEQGDRHGDVRDRRREASKRATKACQLHHRQGAEFCWTGQASGVFGAAGRVRGVARALPKRACCYKSWYGRAMFTGLVEATGQLASKRASAAGHRLLIRHPLGKLGEGESVSVNGVCLTVVAPTSDGFEADASTETTRVTTLGTLPVGARLNLERALRAGDRFGGHLVTGHVDAVAEVRDVERVGESTRLSVSLPEQTRPYVATKGSVALDGVSLTVNAVHETHFEVMLIPHTMKVTNLTDPVPGKRLNLEVDLVARYVARWIEARADTGRGKPALPADDALEMALKRSGLM